MAGSVAKLVHKELLQINKKSLFDDTAVCEPYDEDNPLKIKVTLTPQDGFYAGGAFEFELNVPDTYPTKAPKVSCKTKVYHPNISYEGAVCLNMLNESNPNYQIEHYINGLLFLFHNPNVDSRLNSRVTADFTKLKTFVRDSMMGKTVNGMKFPCVLQRALTFEENLEVFMEGMDSRNLFAAIFETNPLDVPLKKLAQYMTAAPSTAPKFEALLPFLKVALDAAMDINLFFVKTSSGGVLKRSAILKAPENQIVKEMVVLVNGKPVLILTNGTEQLNTHQLSEDLGGPVEIPKMKELRNLIKKPIGFVSAFTAESTETVYMNESILNQEFVYTASGCRWVIAKMRPADLCTLVPNLKVLRNFSCPLASPDTMHTPATAHEAPLEPSDSLVTAVTTEVGLLVV